jgi:hypothetical protein
VRNTGGNRRGSEPYGTKKKQLRCVLRVSTGVGGCGWGCTGRAQWAGGGGLTCLWKRL